VTDSPSRPPYPSRKAGREPATIDLRASEIAREPPRTETAEAAGDPVTEPAAPVESSDHPVGTETPVVSETAHAPAADAAAAADEDAMLSQAAQEASREPPVAPTSAPRRGGGFASLLAASIVGGVIGAGATYLADHYWQRQRGAGDPALQARLTQLDERTTGVARQDAVRGLEQRVGTVAGDVARLSDRLRATEEAAKAATARADEALNRPAPAAATAPSAPTPAPQADTAVVDALAARLEALEARLRERGEANASAAQSATQSAQNATQTAQTAAQQAQSAAQAAQSIEARLADLDRRLGEVSRQAVQRTSEAAASVRIAAATQLVGALREGAPYAPVLAALKSAGVDAAKLAPLESYAQAGAPTAAALRRDFAQVSDRIRREAQQPPADLGDRLWRMFDKVVTVRPIEEAGSQGIPGALARIDEALARGAFTEAAAAWDALPEPARRASEDFARRLKQRAAADEAARTLSAEALSGLEASSRSRS
jgi:hypothetical protein